MEHNRASGVLLHITSLPGRFGIGTLGYEARSFVDFLKSASQKYWQILPFNPVSEAVGFSPYTALSTFAGNPYFISVELLLEKNWVPRDILHDVHPNEQGDFVDFVKTSSVTMEKLKIVFDIFHNSKPQQDVDAYNRFCSENSFWLDDYAFYTALSEYFGTYDWMSWEQGISSRQPAAMTEWKEKLANKIEFNKFLQYIFFEQWNALKSYANNNGVGLIGDIPIYVSFESADSWANPSLFILNESTKRPDVVAGVPPDYFSATGQRWGNPIYKWHDANGKLNQVVLEWWIKRIAHLTKTVDILRIDHFRAFESYWEIPSHETTAINGKWVPGPGKALFDEIRKQLGKLPLIAEDLGVITPEVEKLRDDLELPGMKILQFCFDFSGTNAYLPHNYKNPNCVVYTGTHDNNTTNGWFYGGEVNDQLKQFILNYMGADNDHDFHWKLIKEAMKSTASLCIIPAQDILGFGKEFRMNTPGIAFDNWKWKLKNGALNHGYAQRLSELVGLYNR